MEEEYNDEFRATDGKSDIVPAPLSWFSLLKGLVIGDKLSQSLSYYVKFFLRYAKRLEGLTLPSKYQSHRYEKAVDLLSTNDLKSDPDHAWKGKEFYIALITHKYLAREKVIYKSSFLLWILHTTQRDSLITTYYFHSFCLQFFPDKEKQWAFDVEVVLLPYNLLIHQDNDACIDSLIPFSRNLDFSSSKVGGTFEVRAHGTVHQRQGIFAKSKSGR